MIHPEAVKKAKIKVQEKIDFEFCVKLRICPECGNDLEFDSKCYAGGLHGLKCTKCEATYPKYIVL